MESLLTLDQVVDYLEPVIPALLDEWVPKVVVEEGLEWIPRVFHMSQGAQWVTRHSSAPRGRMWPRWFENQPTPQRGFGAREDFDVEPMIFKEGFSISRLRAQYGMGTNAPLYSTSMLINDLRAWMDDVMRGGILRMPTVAAGVLLDAFSSSAQPMRDGTAMIANAHTDIPGDNLQTTKLSSQLLQEFDDMRVGVMSDGTPRMWRWDTIIVGPKNENKLLQLLNSELTPADALNSVNPFKARFKNVIILPYLDNQIESGASEYVFVLDSRAHQLFGKIYEEPSLQLAPKVDLETIRYEGTMIFENYAVSNSGIAGSTGTVNPA